MTLGWSELTEIEREVAASAQDGRIYDGACSFRLKLDRAAWAEKPIDKLVRKYGPPGASDEMRRTRESENSPVHGPVEAFNRDVLGALDPGDAQISAVRGEFISSLLSGILPNESGALINCSRGVRARGLRVDGGLDLRDLRRPDGGSLPLLRLERCLIQDQAPGAEAAIDASNACIDAIDLGGSILASFTARSARIDGDIDLSGCSLLGAIALAPEVSPSLQGGLQPQVSVEPQTSGDESVSIDLSSAHLGGNLDLSTLRARHEVEQFSVTLQHTRIAGNLLAENMGLRRAIRGRNTITFEDIQRVHFNGTGMDLSGEASFFRGAFDSISLENAHVAGKTNLYGVSVRRDIRADYGRFGQVDLHTAKIDSHAVYIALSADSARIDGILSIGYGFQAKGTISLVRTVIGVLDCRGADINAEDIAIELSSAQIKGGVFGRNEKDTPGLKAHGAVRCISADIGNFDFGGATLEATDQTEFGGVALDISETTVRGSVKLCGNGAKPFSASGAVLMRQTTIFSDLELRGGEFRATPEFIAHEKSHRIDGYKAIDASDLDVRGNVRLGWTENTPDRRTHTRTRVHGALSFDRAEIAGDLVIGDAELEPVEGVSAVDLRNCDLILSFRNAQLSGDLITREPQSPRVGIIDLSGCSARALNDDNGNGWGSPAKSQKKRIRSGVQLRLDGCTFSSFGPAPANASIFSRLKQWLRFNFDDDSLLAARERCLRLQYVDDKIQRGDFYPHAYTQTAHVLRQSGRTSDARRISRLLHKTAVDAKAESFFERICAGFYGPLFGYGYSPGRAAVTLVSYWLIGVLAVGALYSSGWITSAPDDDVRAVSFTEKRCEQDILIYTLDRMLLVIDFNSVSQCTVAKAPIAAPANLAESAARDWANLT